MITPIYDIPSPTLALETRADDLLTPMEELGISYVGLINCYIEVIFLRRTYYYIGLNNSYVVLTDSRIPYVGFTNSYLGQQQIAAT